MVTALFCVLLVGAPLTLMWFISHPRKPGPDDGYETYDEFRS